VLSPERPHYYCSSLQAYAEVWGPRVHALYRTHWDKLC